MESTKVSTSDEDLFTHVPRGRNPPRPTEVRNNAEMGERICFKIGRTKTLEGSSSADLLDNSEPPNSGTSTEPTEPSQRDIFASQDTSSSQFPLSGASNEQSPNTTSSLESFPGGVRTSTPRKRKPDGAGPTAGASKLQRIAEETAQHATKNGNHEHAESPTRSAAAKGGRKGDGDAAQERKESLMDSQMPDTVEVDESPDVELLAAMPRSRKSLEVVYVRSKARISRPYSQVESPRLSSQPGSSQEVVNVEEEEEDDDDSLHLYLSQTQTQDLATVAAEQTTKQVNGSSGCDEDIAEISVVNSSRKSNIKLDLQKDIVLLGDEDDEDDSPRRAHMTSSYSTFAKVRDIAEKKKPSVLAERSGFAPPETRVATEESVHVATFTFTWKCFKNAATGEVISRDRMQCVRVTEQTTPRILSSADISPGVLGDVSKNSSPSSATSTGLFALPAVNNNLRFSVVSTVSSSSTSSVSSAAGLQAKVLSKTVSLTAASRSRSMSGPESVSASKDISVPQEDLLRAEAEPSKTKAGSANFLSPKNGSNLRGLRKPAKTSLEVSGVAALPGWQVPVGVMPAAASSPPGEEESRVDLSSTPSTAEAEDCPSPVTPMNSGRKNKSEALKSKAARFAASKSEAKSKAAKFEVSKSEAKSKAAKSEASKAKAAKSETAQSEISKMETPKSSTKKGARGGGGRRQYNRQAKSDASETPPLIATTIAEAAEPRSTGGKRRKGAADAPPPQRRKLLATPPPPAAAASPAPAELAGPTTVAAFARWTDRRYYSATVLGSLKDGRCSVKFDDGRVKTLPEDCVIRVRELHKHLSVYANVNSRDFESGYITSFKVEDGVVLYVVDLDSGKNVTVPRSALNMTEDQALALREALCAVAAASASTVTTPVKQGRGSTNNSNNINMDNIVYRKRNRKGGSNNEAEFQPAEPVTPRSDASDTANASTDEISGVDMEYFPSAYPSLNAEGLNKASSRVKGRGRANAANTSKKTNDEEITQLLGPIPPAGCKMFAGMQFLFTSNGRTAVSKGSDDNNSSECESNFSFSLIPFVKERLVTQITQGGGTVYNRFEDFAEGKNDDKYLLSNGPCQTANYVLCLANMIPAVTHDYIVYCTKEGRRLPIQNHYLPAGFSVEREKFVMPGDRNSRRVPLRNMNVVLASDADPFVAFWSKVLACAGASVSVLSSDNVDKPSAEDVDVIIADQTFTSTMMAWAIDVGIAVVSSEWAKQCIICWDKCNVRGKTYQYSRLYSS